MFYTGEFLSRSLEDIDSVCLCSYQLVLVARAATNGQCWLNRAGLTAGFVPIRFRTTHFSFFVLFLLFFMFLTARKRNSRETAIALEKLLPKRCQVLGLVTPGVVGRRKMSDFVRDQLEGVQCIACLFWFPFITISF